VTNYANHKENEKRQEGLRIHRNTCGGKRKVRVFGMEIITERQFGRTKIRLVNNIKIDLKVTGIEEREWKDLPQN